jgi:hypothetical protein
MKLLALLLVDTDSMIHAPAIRDVRAAVLAGAVDDMVALLAADVSEDFAAGDDGGDARDGELAADDGGDGAGGRRSALSGMFRAKAAVVLASLLGAEVRACGVVALASALRCWCDSDATPVMACIVVYVCVLTSSGAALKHCSVSTLLALCWEHARWM